MFSMLLMFLGTFLVRLLYFLERGHIHMNVYIYILIYTHTYILTYLHTYILTYLHTYILTYLHTYILIKRIVSQKSSTTVETALKVGKKIFQKRMHSQLWSR